MKTIFLQTFHHETELQKVNDLGGYANTQFYKVGATKNSLYKAGLQTLIRVVVKEFFFSILQPFLKLDQMQFLFLLLKTGNSINVQSWLVRFRHQQLLPPPRSGNNHVKRSDENDVWDFPLWLQYLCKRDSIKRCSLGTTGVRLSSGGAFISSFINFPSFVLGQYFVRLLAIVKVSESL